MRAAIIVLVATAAVGCGSSERHHHHKPAKKTFTAQADAACRSANARVRQLATPPSGAAGVTEYAYELLPIVKSMTAKLAALTPPDSDKGAYGRYLAVLRSDVSELARLHGSSGRSRARQLIAVATAINARGGAQAARQLGLTTCEQHPQPAGH